jgi:hypothetical protein
MHLRQFGTALADLAQVSAAFDVLFRDHGCTIPDHDRLVKSVKPALARRALDAACRAYDSGQPDLTEVAGLEKLAVTTYDGVRGLSAWHRLRWTKRIGRKPCWALQPLFFLSAISAYFRR